MSIVALLGGASLLSSRGISGGVRRAVRSSLNTKYAFFWLVSKDEVMSVLREIFLKVSPEEELISYEKLHGGLLLRRPLKPEGLRNLLDKSIKIQTFPKGTLLGIQVIFPEDDKEWCNVARNIMLAEYLTQHLEAQIKKKKKEKREKYKEDGGK